MISGAASGIGRGLAEGFLAADYRVTAVDRAPLAWQAENLDSVVLDVTDDDAVAALADDLDHLDVLINAAGIIRRDVEFDPVTFAEVVDVNLNGTMRLCKACHPALADGGGAIINIASVLSFFGGPNVPGYSASKGGIATLTKSLAVAWATDGIRVNAIAPGWIDTPLTQALRTDRNRNRNIISRTPMMRWGKPADLVGPALFLASNAAAFVTGVILPVDGGYCAR